MQWLRSWIVGVAVCAAFGCGDSAAEMDGAGSGGAGGGPDPGVDAGGLGVGGDPLEVELPAGRLRGMVSEGTRAFLGIPFGASTGGAARWMPPVAAPSWEGTREAAAFGAVCAQLDPTGASYVADSSEDCLFLNVWAPNREITEALPVMVWIHGGAYVFGSGGEPYNGEALATRADALVVTFNYRLGALGFLAHPALTARANGSDAAPANLGYLDQQLALRWVQDNIAKFGGDPDRVTVFGESAGGNSVCAHLIAESSRGLFQRAIVQSGFCMKPALSLSDAEAVGQGWAAAMGCGDAASALDCLNALTAEAIMTGPEGVTTPGGALYQSPDNQFPLQPIVDGVFLTEQMDAAMAAGRMAEVPVLHGATTAEGALFHAAPLGGVQPVDDAEYLAALQVRFGDRAAEVAAQYVPADYPSHADALSAVSADSLFRCPALRMAEALNSAGRENYLYLFDMTVETTFEGLKGKAFHSSEIPYVFGHPYVLGSVVEADQPVSGAMQDYWASFATAGTPSASDGPAWPAFGAGAEYLHIAQPFAVQSGWREAGCAFWDDLPFAQ